MPAESWPAGTVVALATQGDGPHVIPVSAAHRAPDGSVWLALARTRGSLDRLRADPRVAVLVLSAGNLAVTFHGRAAEAGSVIAGRVVAVRVDVTHTARHERDTFVIDDGVAWRWTNETARARDAEVNELLLRCISMSLPENA